MTVQITTRHIDIGDDIRAHIEDRAEKLRRYFDRIHEVDVFILHERHARVGEVVLHCDGFKVKAQEVNPDVQQAIDRAFDKAERQLKRYKSRLIGRRREARRTQRVTETVMPYAQPLDDELDVAAEPAPKGMAINVEHRELLALTPDEAAMHLDLSGDSFFVFLNCENHHINVMYHRSDGHTGLIEPVVD
jgi:putative sigma-54 modulation protein